jgi:DNA-binding MarR family transcriptional regulator
VDNESHRELKVLEAIAANGQRTQRSLSEQLGMALGLTNLYLKRLVRKGYIKCVHVRSNRLVYLITPKGIGEKTRLTYEFMRYSLDLYRGVRQHLREVLEGCAQTGARRIAIYGVGEAAELAYLSIKEQGLDPVAVFAEFDGTFLGMPVRHVEDRGDIPFDRLIVATLDNSDDLVRDLITAGVSPDKIVTLTSSLPGVPPETTAADVSPARA